MLLFSFDRMTAMPEKQLGGIRPVAKPSEDAEPEKSSVPTVAEESVLATLHEKAEHHRQEEVPADTQLLEKLHGDVENCECYPLFKQYIAGEVPTLERMFGNLKGPLERARADLEAEKQAVGENDPIVAEATKMLNLIGGREQQVRGAIQRYVHSVIRFNHLKKISAGGVRDITRQFVETDRARRQAHNSLIESLRVYTATAAKANEMGLFAENDTDYPFAKWTIGTDARNIPANKMAIFSESVLQNRDFIRDWAIVADFMEQLVILGDKDFLDSMRDRSR